MKTQILFSKTVLICALVTGLGCGGKITISKNEIIQQDQLKGPENNPPENTPTEPPISTPQISKGPQIPPAIPQFPNAPLPVAPSLPGVPPAPAPAVHNLKNMTPRAIAEAVNQNQVVLADGLQELHLRLGAEKGLFQLQPVFEIADAVSILKIGSPVEHLYVLLGLGQAGTGTTLNGLLAVLEARESARYLREKTRLETGVATGGPVLVLPLHADPFLIRVLAKREMASGEAFSYIKNRIDHLTHESLLAQWNDEVAAGGLEVYQANKACTHQGYLKHFTTTKIGLPASSSLDSEIHRYLGELDLPPSLTQRANEILSEYAVVRELVANLGPAKSQWLLETFHFLIHAADFNNRPAQAGVPAMGEAGKAFLVSYLQTWNEQPRALKRQKGYRIPLTTRQIRNLVDEIHSTFSRASSASTASPEAQTIREHLFRGVDHLNFIFESHPQELALDRLASCDASLDPHGLLKVKRVAELVDERFFKVLAPFWEFLAFGNSGFRAGDLKVPTPEHPLTRLYQNRALLAHQREQARLGGAPQWSIRDLRSNPVDADLGGTLYLRPASVRLGQNPKLDEVAMHDLRRYMKELELHYLGDSFSVAHGGITSTVEIESYLTSYRLIEVLRYNLDEDQARKTAHAPFLDPLSRVGESSIRAMLLEEVSKANSIRYQYHIGARAVADMMAIDDLVPSGARAHASKVGGVLHFDSRATHLNITPGIYEAATHDLALDVKSAFVHPLALVFAPDAPVMTHAHGGVMGFVLGGGYNYYVPGDVHLGSRRTLRLTSVEHRVLNDLSTALVNQVDTGAPGLGVITRPYCKAEVPGFRPKWFDSSSNTVKHEDPAAISVLGEAERIRDHFNP